MATRRITHYFDEVASTQAEARQLAEQSGDGAHLVVAQRQTAGRGRVGNTWMTAPRALACSLAVHPHWEIGRWGTIPLAAGLAARSALISVYGVAPSLKWPNDLIMADGKVGGILVESSGDLAVIGLGINLWWPEPPQGVAAIDGSDPGAERAKDIAAAWAASLMAMLDGDPMHWGLADYKAVCATLGADVTWKPSGSGRAVDIGVDGALIVETDIGRTALRSGEVHTVRSATITPGPGTTAEGTAP